MTLDVVAGLEGEVELDIHSGEFRRISKTGNAIVQLETAHECEREVH